MHTDDYEALIFEQMKSKLAEFETLSGKRQNGNSPELTALNVEFAQKNAEINSLMEKLSVANETMFRYINDRIEELDRRKGEIQIRV
jgi:hypothetical protein